MGLLARQQPQYILTPGIGLTLYEHTSAITYIGLAQLGSQFGKVLVGDAASGLAGVNSAL